jgi:hypothetical protein
MDTYDLIDQAITDILYAESGGDNEAMSFLATLDEVDRRYAGSVMAERYVSEARTVEQRQRALLAMAAINTRGSRRIIGIVMTHSGNPAVVQAAILATYVCGAEHFAPELMMLAATDRCEATRNCADCALDWALSAMLDGTAG